MSTAEEEQLAGMSPQGRRIIRGAHNPSPATELSSTASSAQVAQLVLKDQRTSITIFLLRRRLRRQPTGWRTERQG
jgi:hypothetical protein